jgi:hypothetical protein
MVLIFLMLLLQYIPWAGHVTRMEETMNSCRIMMGTLLKKKTNLEDSEGDKT